MRVASDGGEDEVVMAEEVEGSKLLGKVIHMGRVGMEANGDGLEMAMVPDTDVLEDLQ